MMEETKTLAEGTVEVEGNEKKDVLKPDEEKENGDRI